MNSLSSGPQPPVDLLDRHRPIAPAEHLIVIALAMRVVDGEVLYDLQSRDTVYRYLNSFKTMIIAGPRLPESKLDLAKHLVWVPVPELRDRVQFVPLPGYKSSLNFPLDLVRTVPLLRRCIDAAQFIQCGIGGGNGGFEYDWAAVTAELAWRKGRKYSVLTDGVSYDIPAQKARAAKGLPGRLKYKLREALIRNWQHRLISRCDLMFCNGMDTFLTFSPVCKSPDVAVKINDFQIGPEKIVSPERAEAKAAGAEGRTDLRVCYAGRAVRQKAPIEWINAVAEARRLGADVKAVWMGNGELLDAMHAEVGRLGLADVIELPGFVSDRDAVIDRINDSDLMLFTHLEPESPRVLIESLMSATPIVGYDRPHPRDLISENGGGEICPLGDWKALGAALADLARDRARLADLIRKAGRDGRRFDSDVMNRYRSDLIKQRLA